MNQSQYSRSRPGTIKDMRQVCQQWTKDQNGKRILAGSLYNRYIVRSLSIYLTWFFVAIGIRAHVATLMMTIAGVIGIVLCVPHVIAEGVF